MRDTIPSIKPFGVMLTVKDIAAYFQVDAKTVYGLIEEGLIVCHRIGLGRGTIRVSEKDLASYLASVRCVAAEPSRTTRRKRLKHIRL